MSFNYPQVEVDENGKIVDARFKTFGCGSAIASSSLATEWVKGKTVRPAHFKSLALFNWSYIPSPIIFEDICEPSALVGQSLM